MYTITECKKINTLEDLQNFAEKHGMLVKCEISHRGGGVGVRSQGLADNLKIEDMYLPPSYGAACNYLGGGVRGSVFASGYNTISVTGRKAKLLGTLAAACIRVYLDIENEAGANDEEDEDGDINWDARATNASRDAGIRSAY